MADRLDRLKKEAESLARAERERAAGAEARQAREVRDQQETEQRRRRRQAQAPSSFLRSTAAMRAWLALGLLLALAGAGLLDPTVRPLAEAVVPVGGLLVGVYLALSALSQAGWRARLPFQLVGFDTIEGEDDSDEEHVPWIAFEITVRLRREDPRAVAAVEDALKILASRANAEMAADESRGFGAARFFGLAPGHRVLGEGTAALYTTSLLQRWLRREMRLVAHETGLVESVVIDARYTGQSYHLSSD